MATPTDRLSKTGEAAGKAYDCAVMDIKNRKFDSAYRHCRKAVSLLAKSSSGNKDDSILVKCALAYSDLCHRLRKHPSEAEKYIALGMTAAQSLGDQRHLTLYHFHWGRCHGMAYRTKEAITCYAEGLDLMHKIGDKEIVLQSAQFCGQYYFLSGLMKETEEYCEMALTMETLGDDHIMDFMTPIMLSYAHVIMGQFHRAVGVMDSAWRRANLDSDQYLSPIYRSALGEILSMAGRMEESHSHLISAIKEATDNDDVYALLLIHRAFAHYYFVQGNLPQSHRSLSTALALSHEYGLAQPFYAVHYALELLLTFQKHSLTALDGIDLDAEVAAALSGPNALVRGLALRLLAGLENRVVGGTPENEYEKIEALLQESESELIRANAVTQLARTRAEMALLRLYRNDFKSAGAMALKAWESWSNHEHGPFPEKLQALIRSREEGELVGSVKKDGLTAYLHLLEMIPFTTEPNELISAVIRATCHLFEAERGGFFLPDASSGPVPFLLEWGYNLNARQVALEKFRTSLNTVSRCFKNKAPVAHTPPYQQGNRAEQRVDAVFCLPFEWINRKQGVLYFGKSNLAGTFEAFNNEQTTRLIKGLEVHCTRMYQFGRQIENRSRQTAVGIIAEGQDEAPVVHDLSQVYEDVLKRAEMAARTDAPVLILGETGVGKEILARYIHSMSPRRSKAYIPINPACITESLVDSELFGHEKGAFTGADREKPGRIELAHRGTFFIDEVGDIPAIIQTKLLRALEEKSFVRVGGISKREVDFRLITATNRDLIKEVEEGRFRQDLYYRLCVVTLKIPPLRERGEDVITLAEAFLSHFQKRYHLPTHHLDADEVARLKAYSWPGNIRELKNTIEQSVIMSGPGKFELSIPQAAPGTKSEFNAFLDKTFRSLPTLDDLQSNYIRHILHKTNGKISGNDGATGILGIKRTTLYKRMAKLGIN